MRDAIVAFAAAAPTNSIVVILTAVLSSSLVGGILLFTVQRRQVRLNERKYYKDEEDAQYKREAERGSIIAESAERVAQLLRSDLERARGELEGSRKDFDVAQAALELAREEHRRLNDRVVELNVEVGRLTGLVEAQTARADRLVEQLEAALTERAVMQVKLDDATDRIAMLEKRGPTTRTRKSDTAPKDDAVP